MKSIWIQGRYFYLGRFWNANGANVCIVAVVNPNVDWATYAGGMPYAHTEDEAMMHVARKGDKLSEADAKYFFGSEEFAEFPYRP